MKTSYSRTILLLVAYLAILLIEGYTRVSIIISHFEFEQLGILKAASQLNMLIMAIFAVFILVVIYGVQLICIELFALKTRPAEILNALRTVLIFLIFINLVKLGLDLFFMDFNYIDWTNIDQAMLQIQESSWFQLISYLDYIAIAASTLIFAFELGFNKLKDNLSLTSVFALCYVLIFIS
ncbi:MAG: hypothetical protein ACPGRE_09810 [Flavobacteriaceae bacterium]